MATTANFSVQTLKSLEIEGVKINEIQGSKSTFVTKGNLEICYSPEYDRFVLRLNNFKYALSKNIPVTALFAPRSFRAYTFPTTNGHYIVKLKSMTYPALLQNFETILSTYGQLSYKPGQETELLNQAKGQGDYPINFVWYYSIKFPSKIKMNKCESSEKNDKNEKNEKVEDIPEEHRVKTLDTLRKNGTEVIEFNKNGFEGMIFFSNLVEKELANPDAKTNTPTPTPNSKTSNDQIKWEELKKKTTEGAKTFWKGVDGAATMLSNALLKKKSKKEMSDSKIQKEEEKPQEIISHNDNIRKNNDTDVYPNQYENYAKPIEHYQLQQSQQQSNGMQSQALSDLNISDYQQIPDEVKSQIENIIEYIKVRDMNEEEARLNISEKIIKVYPQLESVIRREAKPMYAPNIEQADNFK